MDKDERQADVLADWFATRAVTQVGPGYTSRLERMGAGVVRETTPPPGNGDVSQVADTTAHIPRWRVGGVSDHEGEVCPLCVAGYAFGRAESTPTPDMAVLCYACQRDIASLCALIAARASRTFGHAVFVRDVLERFFSELAPIGPLGRRYGHAY